MAITGDGRLDILQAPPLADLPELTRDFKRTRGVDPVSAKRGRGRVGNFSIADPAGGASRTAREIEQRRES